MTDKGSVYRLYDAVKEMAVTFDLKPNERINEGALARQLGASRTPLREALNRLAAEGLLTVEAGRGFFCRTLDAGEIREIYELRLVIEEAVVRRVCAAAARPEVQALLDFVRETGTDDVRRSVVECTAIDETFHERLAEMAGNGEMSRVLRNLNHRIRFIRWIEMGSRRPHVQGEHQAILEAILAGDESEAVGRLRAHITKRQDQITAAVREGYARIYHDRAETVVV